MAVLLIVLGVGRLSKVVKTKQASLLSSMPIESSQEMNGFVATFGRRVRRWQGGESDDGDDGDHDYLALSAGFDDDGDDDG